METLIQKKISVTLECHFVLYGTLHMLEVDGYLGREKSVL